MANQVVGNKYTWVIKNFSPFPSTGIIRSDIFVIGGCKWRLLGCCLDSYFRLILQDLPCKPFKPLPPGRGRYAQCLLTIVNQNSEKSKVAKNPFMPSHMEWISSAELPFTTLKAKDGGYLVNDELTIVAEIDVSKEDEEKAQPTKKIKLENDGAASVDVTTKTSSVKKTVDINGFQVLPSQVELVNRIFRKHPNIAVGFPFKSHRMKTSSMNFLLSLIESLCKSFEEFSNEDLVEADTALAMVKSAGFKVDWLEKKLEEIKEKKKEEEIGVTRMKELEEELNDFKKNCSDIEAVLEREKEKLKTVKQKCVDIEARLEKEKAKVLATRAALPLTLDDVI